MGRASCLQQDRLGWFVLWDRRTTRPAIRESRNSGEGTSRKGRSRVAEKSRDAEAAAANL